MVLGEAHTTNPVDFTVAYADATATTFTEGGGPAQSNGTTNTELLAAPGASTQRVVKDITIFNNDTVSHVVTLYYRVTATDYVFYKETLSPGAWAYPLRDGVFEGSAAAAADMVLSEIQTVTGAKTFNSGKFILAGSSSGTTTVNATAAASGTLTLPAATDTLVGKDTTDTLTNKTLTSPVLNTPTVGTSIKPVTSGGADLGGATRPFANLYISDGGKLYFYSGTDYIEFIAGSGINVAGHIKPTTNGAVNLGDSTHQYLVLYLSDSIQFDNDISLTQSSNMLTVAGGDFTAPNLIAQTAFLPDANDGAALGTTALQFSDLFLAEGGVINWDNGDVTLTQSGNTLTVAGGSLTAAIAPRVVTTTDDSTAVIDLDATDRYHLTAIANATTISTTGTLVSGKARLIRLKDAGVAKGLTWDSIFRAIGVTLPTTTVAGKTHYIVTIDNTDDSKVDVVDVRTQA
jgi:hypothetical protein